MWECNKNRTFTKRSATVTSVRCWKVWIWTSGGEREGQAVKCSIVVLVAQGTKEHTL